MTTLEEEALNELHKEAYNDKITISDLTIIADYHKCLINVLRKKIDERINLITIGTTVKEFTKNADIIQELSNIKELLK